MKTATGWQVPLLTVDEVAERLPARPSGQRPRIDRVQGRDQLYRVWTGMAIHRARKGKLAPDGWFRTSWLTTAAALGYELTGDRKQDMSAVYGTLYRRAIDLREAGLIEFRPALAASGQIEALEVRICPEVRAAPGSPNLRAGACLEGGGRWRRGSSHRKKPPRCRRGRCGPDDDAGGERPLFFAGSEVSIPLRTDPPPLRGWGGRIRDGRARTREGPGRDGPDGLSGQVSEMGEGARRELRVAWRHRERTAGLSIAGCDPAERLVELLGSSSASEPLPTLEAGFALIFGRRAKRARRLRARQLERALRRVDRYGPDGRSGRELLIDWMVDHRSDPAPAGLGFWAARLDWQSKQYRRAARLAANRDPVRGDA